MGTYCISFGAADGSRGFTSLLEMASFNNREMLEAIETGIPNLLRSELFVIVLPSTNLTQE